MQKTLLGLSMLILLGFIWGTGYSIARFAMTNGVPPLGYSFWQSLGPALILALITLARQSSRQAFNLQALRFYLVSGLTGIAIPNTAMYFAASHLPASILAIIVNTVPIIAYPMALCTQLETFNWQRIVGIVLASCGVLLILIPSASLPAENRIFWVLLTLITPLSFAFCSIYIARFRPKDSDTLALTAGMLIASSFMLAPLVFFTHTFYVLHLPFTLPDWVIVLEILLSSIGYILFFQLIKIAGPVYYSLVDTIVVLTGIFWGYIIFHEQLNRFSIMAVCLIVTALLLVTRQQRSAANL